MLCVVGRATIKSTPASWQTVHLPLLETPARVSRAIGCFQPAACCRAGSRTEARSYRVLTPAREGTHTQGHAHMSDRGTGITTTQLKAAPFGAVYVYAGHRDYTARLAKSLGRTDLRLVNKEWLEHSWHGLRMTGLVVDHAADLTEEQNANFNEITRLLEVYGPRKNT